MGEFFALITALCWTGSSVFFTKASLEYGSETVNRTRLILAFLVVTLINFTRWGQIFPTISTPALIWLLISGLIGYSLGDAMLFEAFVYIGARHAMLLMTLAPLFSALIGWIFLKETLNPWQIMAITLTLAGIALVLLNPSKKKGTKSLSLFGILMGLGGALGQAVGLLFSKKGMLLGVAPFEANQVRLLAGALSILVWGLLRGQIGNDFSKLAKRKGWQWIGVGTLFGPIFGVFFSLMAVQHAHMALAATLMGLTPVMLLPVMRYAYGERFSLNAIVGTFIAVLGAALLFWV